MRTLIQNFAKVGLIEDRPGHVNPPGAMKKAINILPAGDRLEPFFPISGSFSGLKGASGYHTTVAAAKRLFPLYSDSHAAYTFAFSNDARIWMVDNANVSTDITRTVGGSYIGSNRWDFFQHGSMAFFNNGVDTPQVWTTISSATKLVNLPNWPAATTCKVLVKYKDFFIALGVTEGGIVRNSMMKWSSPAPVDTYPTSWDDTNPSTLAGEFTLPGTNSPVLDAIVFNDVLYIFKPDCVIAVTFVGGNEIFYPRLLTSSWGILSKHCICEVEGNLAVITSDGDIGFISGVEVKSIIRDRLEEHFKVYALTTNPAQDEPLLLRYDSKKKLLYIFETPSNYTTSNVSHLAWSFEHQTWSLLSTLPINDACQAYYDEVGLSARKKGLVAVGVDTYTFYGDYRDAYFSDLSNATGVSGVYQGATLYPECIFEYFNILPFESDQFGNLSFDIYDRKIVTRIWPIWDHIQPLLSSPTYPTMAFSGTFTLMGGEKDLSAGMSARATYSIYNFIVEGVTLDQQSAAIMPVDAPELPIRGEGRLLGLHVALTNVASQFAIWNLYGFWVDSEKLGSFQ